MTVKVSSPKSFDSLILAMSGLWLWLLFANSWFYLPVALATFSLCYPRGQAVFNKIVATFGTSSLMLVLTVLWLYLFFNNSWLFFPVALLVLSLQVSRPKP